MCGFAEIFASMYSGRIDPVGYGSAENEDINLFRKLQPFNESDDDLRNATSLNFDGTRNDSGIRPKTR